MPPSLLFQVKTAELDPSRSYLLGSHPHGVLCSGAVSAFATEGIFDQKLKRSLPASFLGPGWSELFPGLESHLLTLMIQFCIPGHRELVYWFVFSWQKLVCTGLSKSRTRIYMHLLFCPIKKTCIFWFVYIFVRNLYICFGIFLTSCFPNQDAAPYKWDGSILLLQPDPKKQI